MVMIHSLNARRKRSNSNNNPDDNMSDSKEVSGQAARLYRVSHDNCLSSPVTFVISFLVLHWRDALPSTDLYLKSFSLYLSVLQIHGVLREA